MAEWNRDNPWRQGHVYIPEANCSELEGISIPKNSVVVVISHDCDLAQSIATEPFIEIIVGSKVERKDGNCTHGKNIRNLHLPFSTPKGDVIIELLTKNKVNLPKENLINSEPSNDFSLTPERYSILQRWLAARYRRAAFPDEFDRRLDERTGLKKELTKILKPLGAHIPAIFFDVDDGKEIKHETPEDTFTLDIYLLYSTLEDPDVARKNANEAKDKIVDICKKKLYDKEHCWQFIELRDCVVMSDEEMSYQQSCIFKKWQIDYISLKENPQQSMANN